MKEIRFVCVHNTDRSQIAEAFTNLLKQDIIHASSARIKPTVVKDISEPGIDLGNIQGLNE